MAKLTGQTIAASYDQLLIVGDADGITATAQAVESADTGGNASLLYLSTTEVYCPGPGGTSNTTFGKNAGDALTTNGNYNVIIGEEAGTALTTGDNNVAIGYNALYRATTATDSCVAIGEGAMSGNFTTADVNNIVAIGKSAMSGVLTTDASGTIAIGKDCLAALTSGADNIAIGQSAMLVHTTGSRNIAIGRSAMLDTNDGAYSLASTDNIFIGHYAGDGTWENAAQNQNVAVGNYSMSGVLGEDSGGGAGDGALYNTCVGYSAGTSITSGDSNVLIGRHAGLNITSGGNNVIIGMNTADVAEDVDYAVIIGSDACHTGNLTSNTDGVVAIGQDALGNLTDGVLNMGIGKSAGAGITTGGGNTIIGAGAGDRCNAANANNTVVGADAFSGDHSSGSNSANVAIGQDALKGDLNSSHYNHAIGYGAMANLVSGDKNIAIGGYALDAANGGEADNIAIGYDAIGAGDGPAVVKNIAIGNYALSAATTHSTEVAIGYNAMLAWTGIGDGTDAAGFNIAVGYGALGSNTSSRINVAIGGDALGDHVRTDNADGYNVGIGHDAGRCLTTGIQNTFVGALSAGTAAKSLTGHSNTAVGYLSANDLDGAAIGNTCIGKSAGEVITTGSYNTIIGYENEVAANDRAGTVVLGSQTDSGTNNTVRIGSTTGYAELLLNGSDEDWSAASDIRLKENIEDSTIGLSFISDLRPITYNWKKKKDVPSDMPRYKEGSDEPYNGLEVKTLYGFVAQEVKEIIDNHELSDGQAIWSEDPSGVQHLAQGALMTMMVKAVQELSAKVKALEDAQ